MLKVLHRQSKQDSDTMSDISTSTQRSSRTPVARRLSATNPQAVSYKDTPPGGSPASSVNGSRPNSARLGFTTVNENPLRPRRPSESSPSRSPRPSALASPEIGAYGGAR